MKQLASSIVYLSAVAAICLFTGTAVAQQPIRHELIRGDMPPGLAADYARLGNPRLEGFEQPVRLISPLGARVEVASGDGYISVNSSKVSVGMLVGPVYRFKLTDIPNNIGRELYPSVEILNRLYPPKGLENEFPIEIVISQDDLKQALQGRLVTKVIYLENPETALPHRHVADNQPFFDVGGGEDPLRAAEKLGRPMAILRIGSRIPLPNDVRSDFNFNAPSAKMLPDPQTPHGMPGDGDWLPPIVPGEFVPSSDARPLR